MALRRALLESPPKIVRLVPISISQLIVLSCKYPSELCTRPVHTARIYAEEGRPGNFTCQEIPFFALLSCVSER